MNTPIKVELAANGLVCTNVSDVDQVVTVAEGPATPEEVRLGQRRSVRMLLRPGESRTVEGMSEQAKMTHSTDTSPVQGTLKILAGDYVENARCETCQVTLVLAKRILVTADDGLWVASVDGLSGIGSSREEALREIGQEIHSAHVMIAQEKDENLTEDAKALKATLLGLVKEIQK